MKNMIAAAVLATGMLFAAAPGFGDTYHYEDIDRFVLAYDEFMRTDDASAFETYLENGSTGLNEFQEQFALSPEYLAESVRTHPNFYASLRTFKSEVVEQEAALNAMFEKLQTFFPDVQMPEVYFLIGGLRAGGQAGEGNYVMVAVEVYSKTPDRDLSEMSPNARMYSPPYIVHIVAHEAAHVIQEQIQGAERYLAIYLEESEGTLLAYSLREGAANLVAKLASGNHINPEAEPFGIENESELWSIFREEALGTELGDWFFYQPKIHPEWPKDLGYWIGYRMGLKCYEDASDKNEMLLRFLDAQDPEALMRECALVR